MRLFNFYFLATALLSSAFHDVHAKGVIPNMDEAQWSAQGRKIFAPLSEALQRDSTDQDMIRQKKSDFIIRINTQCPGTELRDYQIQELGALYESYLENGDLSSFISKIDNLAREKTILGRHAAAAKKGLSPQIATIPNVTPLDESSLYVGKEKPNFKPARRGQPGHEAMKAAYRMIYAQNEKIMTSGYKTTGGIIISPTELGIQQSIASSKKLSPVLNTALINPNHPHALTLTNEDTLTGAKVLLDKGFRKVAIVNFANKDHVGGGYTNGALAQEEDLCRNSTLFTVLDTLRNNGLYPIEHDKLIYSPGVRIIRSGYTTDFKLLDTPLAIDVITQAAYNINGPEKNIPKNTVLEGMRLKIRQSLTVAANNGIEGIILGAFGCGAFGNNPEDISQIYAEILPEFRGFFKEIRFSILSGPNGEPNFNTFKRTLTPLI